MCVVAMHGDGNVGGWLSLLHVFAAGGHVVVEDGTGGMRGVNTQWNGGRMGGLEMSAWSSPPGPLFQLISGSESQRLENAARTVFLMEKHVIMFGAREENKFLMMSKCPPALRICFECFEAGCCFPLEIPVVWHPLRQPSALGGVGGLSKAGSCHGCFLTPCSQNTLPA